MLIILPTTTNIPRNIISVFAILVGLIFVEYIIYAKVPAKADNMQKRFTITTINIALVPLLLIVLSRLYNGSNAISPDMIDVITAFFELLNSIISFLLL